MKDVRAGILKRRSEMIKEPRIALFDLFLSLGTAVDLVSPW
ncbi:MAG: hypothetical protein SWK76_05340 [Actinomycetota bacterium]|nr:hypothetical protein [Actinomycetota bacterium]